MSREEYGMSFSRSVNLLNEASKVIGFVLSRSDLRHTNYKNVDR
jgi:hypothetical protein